MGHSIVLGTAPTGRPVALDLDRLVVSRALFQANSGGGKSHALRRLLEQSHGKVQHLVLDVEGEFHTLREEFDYILAARSGGDTLADVRTAGLLARRLLELGVSGILDLYELPARERVRFVRLFLEALIDAPRSLWHPVLVVVDEAHHFCPEKGHGEAESANAVMDLMTKGRKRGFCGILATQRLSKLHKDAAAEANVKLIGRAALDLDRKRAGDELGLRDAEQRDALRTLAPGHFFAFGPGLSDYVVPVHIGPVKTTHPKAGDGAAPVTPPKEKVKAVLARLADLPKEAEAELRTAAELRGRVADLEKQIARGPKAPAPERVEVPVLGKDVIATLEAAADGMRKQAGHLVEAAEKGERGAQANRAAAETLDRLGRDLIAAITRSSRSGAPAAVAARPASRFQRVAESIGKPLSVNQAKRLDGERVPGEITPARQRILDALLYLEAIGVSPANRIQVALLADASPNSSGYANNLGGLSSAGFLEYPGPGAVRLTEIGRDAARAPERHPTSDDLHATLRAKLVPARWRILEALIAAYPQPLTREDLAEAAGASPLSSGYANNLGGLRSAGLIDYNPPGSVVAMPVLFLEG